MTVDADEPRRLGGRVVHAETACRVFLFDGGVFVVDLVGKLTSPVLRGAIEAVYGHPHSLSRHAVIFHENHGADYDRSVLTFYQEDVVRPMMPAIVGVVARRPVWRMVASAAGLGFRAFTRVPYRVWDDLASGLVEARFVVGVP